MSQGNQLQKLKNNLPNTCSSATAKFSSLVFLCVLGFFFVFFLFSLLVGCDFCLFVCSFFFTVMEMWLRLLDFTLSD